MNNIFGRSSRAKAQERAPAGALPARGVYRWKDYGLALLLVARIQQEWERTFDAVPDLISLVDRQYRILRVNRAMAARLGVAPERCIGLTCYEFVHDLHAPPALCPHTQCLADGRTHTAEVYEERAGGHFLVTCTPLFDPDGQWIGSVHVARDITERKRVEEDLKRSASILAQAGEVAHLGAWEIEFTASEDIHRNPLRWSDEVYRIFGYTPHAVEVSNDLFFQHVHPEDRQRVRDAVAQAIAEKQPYEIEHRIVRPDGTERIVREHAEIKFDERGRPRQIIGAVQDVTERRQADQTLRENEERLRAIFDNAGVGLAEAADGRFVAVNDRFCRILGYARDELVGKTVHELTAPDDRATSDMLNAQLFEGRTDRIDYEKQFLRRDGTPVWTHVTVSALHDPEGRHRRGIATVEDISERKHAEIALRLSERQFKSTFENAAVGITHVRPDGQFVRFNDRFCEITGYAREDLAARSFQEITHPDDLVVENRLRQRLLRGEIGHYSLDKRYIRADGSIVWVSLTASVQRENGGPPEYFIAIVEDISQRKRMEEALRELNATLETKVAQRTVELEQRARQLQRLTLELSQTEDRERRRMAEILHDDLQQVLAAAKFHVSLLRNRVKRDSSLEATAGQIDRMLKEAIEKSRSLSHELSPAVMHHGDLVETLRWLARQVQAKHGLAVHVHAHGEVPSPSEAIKGLFYKAAQELLFNVVKHAGVREAALHVRRRGRYVGLRVADRGRGFDPQELKRTAGFGLLSIRERVELLGGRMKIKSVQGQGSTFSIVVPDTPEEGEMRTEEGRKPEAVGRRS